MSPNGNVSLIDLAMLSDIKHLLFCTTVPPLSTSDHLGVCLAIKWETHTQRHIPKPRHVWLYNNADFSRACHMIDETDWNFHFVDGSYMYRCLQFKSLANCYYLQVNEKFLELKRDI